MASEHGDETPAGSTAIPDQPQLTTIILSAMNEYGSDEDMIDDALWAQYKEDFKDFTTETFRKAKPGTVRTFRKFLRCRGVRVEMESRKANINQSMANILDEEDPAEWSDDDIRLLIKHAGDVDFASPAISRMVRLVKEKSSTGNTMQTIPTIDTPAIVPAHPELGAGRGLPDSSQHGTENDARQAPSIARSYTENARPRYNTNQAFDKDLPHDEHPRNIHQNMTPEFTVPEHTREPTGIKEIMNLNKLYNDDMRYGQSGDGLTSKLRTFQTMCTMAGVPGEAYPKALIVMVKGMAARFYQQVLVHSGKSFTEMCEAIQSRFEGSNFTQDALAKWNTKDLKKTIAKHPNKSTIQCLDILVDELQELYNSLPIGLQNEAQMANKLNLACRDVAECQAASIRPEGRVPVFIDNMKAAIGTYEAIHGKRVTSEGFVQDPEDSDETFMTDRRFNTLKNRYNLPRSRGSYKPNSHQQGYAKQPKRCYVCQREGCWSTNHSEAERTNSREKFRNRFRNKHGDRYNPRNFEAMFSHFLVEYEGDDTLYEEAFKSMEETFNAYRIHDDVDTTEENAECNFNTECGELSVDEAFRLANDMNDMAFRHFLLGLSTRNSPANVNSERMISSDAPNTPKNLQSRYSNGEFYGICIDTGAARVSSVGYGQYLAYNTKYPTPIVPKVLANIQFGRGSAVTSMGTVEVDSPIGKIEFHVLDSDTPFLLCLCDMDKLKVHFNNLTNILHTPGGDIGVIRKFGHPFLIWEGIPSQQESAYDCFLTEQELRRLHRRFGHPAVDRLRRVLERAGHEVDNKVLEHLTKICHYCQKYGRSPGRFRFTLRDDVEFNYCIIVDIFYIDGRPVLHIIDEATRYQAGRWLKDVSSKTVWEAIQECWINTYLGPPDMMAIDAGTSFKSAEIRQNAGSQGITLKDVPIESHNSIGMVERYHGPIRRAYEIISQELPSLNKSAALQMAFKAVNDIAGPDGLVPTLLVYGAYPRMTESDAPSATIIQRAATLKKAMAEARELRAKRQVNDALNTRNGPVTGAVKDLPLNSLVLVFREGRNNRSGHWDGPWPLVALDGEDCFVGPRAKKFRITSVKPYYDGEDSPEQSNEEAEPEPESGSNREAEAQEDQEIELRDRPEVETPIGSESDENLPESDAESDMLHDTIHVEYRKPLTDQVQLQDPQPRRRGRPRKALFTTAELPTVEAFIADPEIKNPRMFDASRLKETNMLMERGVFEIVPESSVPPNTRIFNSRFVDEIKDPGTDKAFEKSRLVIQAYNDPEKYLVLTQSPTIQRASQRIILCIAAITASLGVYLRDITQAYTQSTSNLVRIFYAYSPPELDIGVDNVLRIIKPLYGIPEAGNHWFNTYHRHHLEKLQMIQSTYDPCLLSTKPGDPFGLLGLQVDDTLFVGDEDFVAAEERELRKANFASKELEQLTIEHPLKYNGCKISLHPDGSITMTQERQISSIATVKVKPTTLTSSRGVKRLNASTKDQYIAHRARGSYVATMTQPEASFDLSFAAQVTEPSKDDVQLLNKRLQWQIDNADRGLNMVKLDKNTLRIIVFTDSSFANNRDYTSQIGYVIIVADGENNANIIHWSSTKCRRITRSVLASELYALSNGYDLAASLKSTIETILGTAIPLVVCTDSKSLFDCLVKLGTTQEKRLMVDLMCLRQAYERRGIAEIKWIEGNSNPADAMTKSKACNALKELLDTNRVKLKETEWVERNEV